MKKYSVYDVEAISKLKSIIDNNIDWNKIMEDRDLWL